MSEIRVVSLADVDPIELPGGSWSRILVSGATAETKVMLGFSEFQPRTATDHMVHTADEMAFVVSGEFALETNDTKIRVRESEACHIPAGVWHAVVNESADTPVSMVFVFDGSRYPDTQRRPYLRNEQA